MIPGWMMFSWGVLFASCATAALFFLRFWRESRDRLFVFFALAFALLALHWLGLAFVGSANEFRNGLYLVRWGAFLLIVVGVVDKNARS